MDDEVDAIRKFHDNSARGMAVEIYQLRAALEKHRAHFRTECSEFGYDTEQIEEMLTELEAADPR